MELELLRLAYDYSKNHKFVDKDYIDKVVEIVVSNRKLHDYVGEVSFYSEGENEDGLMEVANYGNNGNDIEVNLEAIKDTINCEDCFESLFGDFEVYLYKNLKITQFILHELEHAYQSKVSKSEDNSVETRLIKTCLAARNAFNNPKFYESLKADNIHPFNALFFISDYYRLYKKYYQFNPIERLAQINSFRTLFRSLDPISSNTPNLYEFMKASYLEEMLSGFGDSWAEGLCPTHVYLEGTRKGDVWKSFDFYSEDNSELMKKAYEQHELRERMMLGLPIYSVEYDDVYNVLSKTNKYNI